MIKGTAVLFVITVAAVHSVYGKSLPSFLKACKRKDPGISDCMKVFMETLIKRSSNGIPELKIPSMEPFIIPQIILDQGSSQAVKLKATYNKLNVFGMSKADVTGFKVVVDKTPYFEFMFRIADIIIKSDYEVDGKLLVVPIKGAGKCDANLTEVTGVLKVNTRLVKRKRGDHLEVSKRDSDVDVKGARFYFENLFNGNKQLGETTNTFINENWQELYKELRPVFAEAISGVVEFVMKIVLDEFTYDELFPPK